MSQLKVINPATEEVINTLNTDTAESVSEKFKRAKSEQLYWQEAPLEERISIISHFKDLLLKNKEELAKIQTAETGKPIKQALGEITATGPRIDYFLENVAATLQAEAASSSEHISYEPLGVIANISAWNYPWFVGTNVYIPALLTGNAVLYKPSELCPQLGLKVEELFIKAGLPEGLFQTLIGDGSIGQELLKQDIRGVFFTGSYGTGKRISEAVGGKLIKIQLELGGKDPIYVMPDANPLAAAEALADGAFYNNGQSCCSVERIYVHQDIHDEFVKHFVKTVKGFKQGDPAKDSTYLGPLTRKEQVELLQMQVEDAESKGANKLIGGQPVNGKGYYFEPTVFSNVNHNMLLMKDESFGPIIGIQSVKDDDEATELMNDTVYGLTAGVYGNDERKARLLLSKINSGSVYYNCCDRVSPRLPWTGRGHSGIGSTLSKIGILAFVQPKAWHNLSAE
jgi:acyl-CoA reductase-like NAD-dependent aldehyde dehydrogenase